MIKFKVEIEFRDDKKEVFDCSEHPSIGDRYLILFHDSDNRKYIPQEAIKSIKVKDYWKNNKR